MISAITDSKPIYGKETSFQGPTNSKPLPSTGKTTSNQSNASFGNNVQNFENSITTIHSRGNINVKRDNNLNARFDTRKRNSGVKNTIKKELHKNQSTGKRK